MFCGCLDSEDSLTWDLLSLVTWGFLVWGYTVVWLSFSLPDYQTSVLPISFCREIVYYFVRPTMHSVVHYSLSFEELRFCVENSKMIGLETDCVVCWCYLPWTEGSFILHSDFDNVKRLHYLFLLAWVISLALKAVFWRSNNKRYFSFVLQPVSLK